MATIIVNSLSDDVISGDGLVTLREAIIAANADGNTFTELVWTGKSVETGFLFGHPTGVCRHGQRCTY